MAIINLSYKYKAKLRLIFKNLEEDITYRYGGWVGILFKLIYNAFFMWLVFGFARAFFYFGWKTYELTDIQIRTLNLVYFSIAMIWLIIMLFSSSRDKD